MHHTHGRSWPLKPVAVAFRARWHHANLNFLLVKESPVLATGTKRVMILCPPVDSTLGKMAVILAKRITTKRFFILKRPCAVMLCFEVAGYKCEVIW